MDKGSLDSVQRALHTDRATAFALLEDLFLGGEPPNPPLDGTTRGQLIALDIAPGVTAALSWLTSVWLPWQGKTFNAAAARGDNIFSAGSKAAARIFNPGYRNYVAAGSDRYRAFAFRTYLAPARESDAQQVLKLDYDLPENPKLTIRRVLDELVQIDRELFLGKAHVRWWSGRWQRVAYFSLARDTAND